MMSFAGSQVNMVMDWDGQDGDDQGQLWCMVCGCWYGGLALMFSRGNRGVNLQIGSSLFDVEIKLNPQYVP